MQSFGSVQQKWTVISFSQKKRIRSNAQDPAVIHSMPLLKLYLSRCSLHACLPVVISVIPAVTGPEFQCITVREIALTVLKAQLTKGTGSPAVCICKDRHITAFVKSSCMWINDNKTPPWLDLNKTLRYLHLWHVTPFLWFELFWWFSTCWKNFSWHPSPLSVCWTPLVKKLQQVGYKFRIFAVKTGRTDLYS